MCLSQGCGCMWDGVGWGGVGGGAVVSCLAALYVSHPITCQAHSGTRTLPPPPPSPPPSLQTGLTLDDVSRALEILRPAACTSPAAAAAPSRDEPTSGPACSPVPLGPAPVGAADASTGPGGPTPGPCVRQPIEAAPALPGPGCGPAGEDGCGGACDPVVTLVLSPGRHEGSAMCSTPSSVGAQPPAAPHCVPGPVGPSSGGGGATAQSTSPAPVVVDPAAHTGAGAGVGVVASAACVGVGVGAAMVRLDAGSSPDVVAASLSRLAVC